jgi:hypothetical protein
MCNGNECFKILVRKSRQSSLQKIVIDPTQQERVEHIKYFGGITIFHVKLIEHSHGKTAFNMEKNLYVSKLHLSLRGKIIEVLHMERSYSGAPTWTFRRLYQKYLANFEGESGSGWSSVGLIV